MTESIDEKNLTASQVELVAHLSDLKQLFFQRPTIGLNLLAYNQAWWEQYCKRYFDLGPEVLKLHQTRAVNYVYELCTQYDRGIRELFCIMLNAHTLRTEYRTWYLDDWRWQEYCHENYCTDKAELKYRYVTVQKILGTTYQGWQMRDGEHFEQQIWPAVKDELATQTQQPTESPPKSSENTDEPTYDEIVGSLKKAGWLTDDGKPKRACADLLSVARYVVDLDQVSGCRKLQPELVKKLSRDYGLAPLGRINRFIGSPTSWLINAQEWLK